MKRAALSALAIAPIVLHTVRIILVDEWFVVFAHLDSQAFLGSNPRLKWEMLCPSRFAQCNMQLPTDCPT